jgi:hypothetical protein
MLVLALIVALTTIVPAAFRSNSRELEIAAVPTESAA